MDNLLISPKEVKDHINSPDNGYLLLDIRREDEFKDWNIKGSINIPVNDLISDGNFIGIKEMLASLPLDDIYNLRQGSEFTGCCFYFKGNGLQFCKP